MNEIESVGRGAARRGEDVKRRQGSSESFERSLAEVRLSFSKHATERVTRRELPLGAGELRKIEAAVDRAEVKGARNSLVIMDRLALIVNVPSRKVVTAMNGENLRDGVVTNIDSTVIVNE